MRQLEDQEAARDRRGGTQKRLGGGKLAREPPQREEHLLEKEKKRDLLEDGITIERRVFPLKYRYDGKRSVSTKKSLGEQEIVPRKGRHDRKKTDQTKRWLKKGTPAWKKKKTLEGRKSSTNKGVWRGKKKGGATSSPTKETKEPMNHLPTSFKKTREGRTKQESKIYLMQKKSRMIPWEKGDYKKKEDPEFHKERYKKSRTDHLVKRNNSLERMFNTEQSY